jgi:3-oxoacyl-[acyl-carrier-protein] synthase III
MQRPGIPPEKCLNNIDRYGKCSAAVIPILLAEARDSATQSRAPSSL